MIERTERDILERASQRRQGEPVTEQWAQRPEDDVLDLQRTAGNDAVQRLMRDKHGAHIADRPKPATHAVDPNLALVVDYLRGQVDNWHEGSVQGCTKFLEWSRGKPGVTRDFWMNLAGNVIWAVGNTTTAGLIGIGLGAAQSALSAGKARKKAEAVQKIYEEILTKFNDMRSAMTKQAALESFSNQALANADIRTAIEEGGHADIWGPRVRQIANAPEGDDVNLIRNRVYIELMKRYWDESVGEVEVVYAAYQSQPMAINIALDEWPEVARIIRGSDVNWHIYKDKKIVGTQGGTRVEIPVDHPARDKVEQLVRTLEDQAIKE